MHGPDSRSRLRRLSPRFPKHVGQRLVLDLAPHVEDITGESAACREAPEPPDSVLPLSSFGGWVFVRVEWTAEHAISQLRPRPPQLGVQGLATTAQVINHDTASSRLGAAPFLNHSSPTPFRLSISLNASRIRLTA